MMDIPYVIKNAGIFLKEKGYTRRGSLFFLCSDNTCYAIKFYAPNGIMYCSFFVMPFFFPFEVIQFSYGDRISAVLSSFEKRPTEKEIKEWTDEFIDQYHTVIEKFFNSFAKHIDNYRVFPCPSCFFCTPLDYSQLQLCLKMYHQDIEGARAELAAFSSLLDSCNYLTKECVDQKRVYAKRMQSVLSAGEKAVNEYIAKTVSETKALLRIIE